MPARTDLPNALSSLPVDHGFTEGDHVELPVAPRGTIRGKLRHIDLVWGRARYVGLVLVADDDGRCYEFHPEIARRIP